MPAPKKAKLTRFQKLKQNRFLRNRYALFAIVFALIGGVYFLSSSHAATLNCTSITINDKTSGQGLCVSYLQQTLSAYGYNPGTINGNFGEQTRQAILQFKQDINKLTGSNTTVNAQTATIDPTLAATLCSVGLNLNVVQQYCGTTTTTQTNFSSIGDSIRSLVGNNTSNIHTQITNTGGQTQIGNQNTTVTNTNTQVTNTGGQTQVGNSGSTNQSTTTTTAPATNPNPTPAVDPAQAAAAAAARAALLQQISSQYGNGGSVSVNNGQVVVNNSGGCTQTVTLNGNQTYTINTCTSSVSNGGSTPVAPTPKPVQAAPTPAPAAPTASHSCPNHQTLVYNGEGTTLMQGACVFRVQELLNQYSGAGLKVDGYYGKDSSAAVTRWQQTHGLQADGKVGNQTWTSLESGGVNNSAPVGNAPGSTSAPKTSAPSTSTNKDKPANTPANTTDCTRVVLNHGDTSSCVGIAKAKLIGDCGGNLLKQNPNTYDDNMASSVACLRKLRFIQPCDKTGNVVDGDVWKVLMGGSSGFSNCGSQPKPAAKVGTKHTSDASADSNYQYFQPASDGSYVNEDAFHACVSISPKDSSTFGAWTGKPSSVTFKTSNKQSKTVNLNDPKPINNVVAKATCTTLEGGANESTKVTVDLKGFWINVYNPY